MEYLQIFDKDKNMLDEKILRSERFNIEKDKFIMVTIIFIENSEGKFLIQRTSHNKGHEFATTGGHVSYKDTSLTTILKETKEELGISLKKDEIKYISTFIHKFVFIDTYYCKKDINIEELKLQESEVESVEWLSVEEIENLIKNNNFRKGNIKPFQSVLESRK